ncbi:MAG: hypothetical protein ACE5HT_00930 [Gemmatimonadales bacterium]
MRATNDPVALALASLIAGAATGATIITAGLITLRSLSGGEGASQQVPSQLTALDIVLQASLLTGVIAAAATAWLLTRAIQDYYRRGMVAALGVVGNLVLAGVAVPVDVAGHRAGLAVYLLLLILLTGYSMRKARAAAAS